LARPCDTQHLRNSGTVQRDDATVTGRDDHQRQHRLIWLRLIS